jgi:ATP-dependent Clp protease ATP-binding subunit ClpA
VIFRRFTSGPRACVEAALEEAWELGHDTVGGEDLLLGILRANAGLGAGALSSLGVTLEGAQVESERMASDALLSVGVSLEDIRTQVGEAFDMRLPDDRRLRFSPRAKKALGRALHEARRLGDGHIGTEHVLLGILGDEDGTAVRMLARMGVAKEALGERVLELREREAR